MNKRWMKDFSHATRLNLRNREYREQMQQLKLSGAAGGGAAVKPGQVDDAADTVTECQLRCSGLVAVTCFCRLRLKRT